MAVTVEHAGGLGAVVQELGSNFRYAFSKNSLNGPMFVSDVQH